MVNGNRLVVEDRVNRFFPSRNERVLWIAGTAAYYSAAPLDPDSHRLLCYHYCDKALKLHKHDFYHHALVLGCGGGAIPRWLLEEYPSVSVDVVDYSQEIIDICKEYFLYPWEDCSRLTFYCTDAQDFMRTAYQYQFVFCDLFDGSTLAPFVYTPTFAARLRRMISDDGILVINCGWNHLDDIIRAYQSAFAYVQVIDREPWQTEAVIVSDSPIKKQI